MTVGVRIRDLRWDRGGRRVLDIPELDLAGPGMALLTGANGSGKSSLLRVLTQAPAELHGGTLTGSAHVQARAGSRRPRVGYVPQDPHDAFLAFDAHTEFRLRLQAAGWTPQAADVEAARRTERLDLADRANVPVVGLSGGERKRVAVHAALTHDPDLLVLDEPLSHLDTTWGPRILEDLQGAAEARRVIVSDPDVDPWLAWVDRVVVLREGRIAFQGDVDEFQAERVAFDEIREPLPAPHYPTPAVMGATVLRAQGLRARRGRPLVDDVELDLPTGLHAFVGPNGSGKTSLLRILSGLDPPDRGRVLVEGLDVHAASAQDRCRRVAVHFETPSRLFFHATLQAELAYQPRNAGADALEQETRALAAAAAFRLTGHLERHPHTLSGGEQERAALACVEASRARLLVLDEPTHGLDAQGWRDLVAFLERHRAKACIVVATHDPELVRLADTVHRIEDGRVRPVRLGTRSALVEVVARAPS